MIVTYEEIITQTPMGESKVIKRNDGAFIPCDIANSDYQAYLKSLENAN
jgi:hypothetical protein